MKIWMAPPYRTPTGYWRWGFWTDAKWPFYRASIITYELDFELALKCGQEWAAKLREHLKDKQGAAALKLSALKQVPHT